MTAESAAAPKTTDLVERLRAGELLALSRVATELERLSPAAPQLIAELTPHLGRAMVVGFTGPPGAGKSTLVNAYITVLRRQDRTVGVIAVDPSSPVSGGALLGDRLRMTEHTGDDGVFIRSLASRGHLGGLTPAAVRVIDAFDAAGRDVVILETVGAGQSEIDIAEIADTRVVLNAPGLGDDIQAMKSGILEIADIVVVNKADLPGAEATLRQLQFALSLGQGRKETPILKTVATSGEGVAELAAEIMRVSSLRNPDPQERRRRRARRLLAWAAADLIERQIREQTGPEVDALCDDILAGTTAPAAAARKLLAKEKR
jgi:LAO/AO transport system kinase